MSNMITSGLSALVAYQRAIDVAAQNIANTNTDGYVRQKVELSTQFAPVDRFGISVGGVKVDGVRREVNAFLIDQSRTAAAGAGRSEVMKSQAERIMSLLGSTALGIDDALQSLKNAFESLATDPASLRARDALIFEIESTVDRFKTLDGRVRGLAAEINGKLETEVSEVNVLLNQVAATNDKIFRSSITTGISPANVLDERDRLLDKLAEKIGFKIVIETNDTVSVKTLDNRLLVKGSVAGTVTLADGSFDPADKRVLLRSADGISSELSAGLGGGILGGLVDARQQLVTPTRNEIGRIAWALTQTLNAQNQAGRDLDGLPGASLLSIGQPTVFKAVSNSTGSAAVTASVTVTSPPAALTNSDYKLTRTDTSIAPSGWRVTRADTGVEVDHTVGVNGAISFEGVSVAVDIPVGASVATGDAYLIRPTHDLVSAFAVSMSDARRIAAAGPPAPGTTTVGSGDNRNALELATVIERGVLENGKTSVMDATVRLGHRVGAQARAAQLTYDVQKLAVEETQRERADLHGVSLDEEAATLMRYQQAYQASAAVIRAANELFDVLLDATN